MSKHSYRKSRSQPLSFKRLVHVLRTSKIKGFSLVELLVVLAIIGFLAGIILPNLKSGREGAKVVQANFNQRQLATAVELYYNDVGFYPPDVNRGWDPGFERALPWNPDRVAGKALGAFTSSGANCSHCPASWQSKVQARWGGPYTTWPSETPWGGKYDYNYWGSGANRSGCKVLPGIYIGVQGDYSNKNTIPKSAEDKMIEKGFDSEKCNNGESQMVLKLFEVSGVKPLIELLAGFSF